MGFSHGIFFCTLIVFELLGLLTFMKGFFPVKTAVPGYSKPENITSEPFNDEINILHFDPPFNRMVFILIDALRADFVLDYGSSDLPHMVFVSDEIKNGKAQAFMARAHPPTVTMPRIKALTSGGIPGFIDVVLNFDSSSLSEDNLISQLHRQNKRMVFYGDDTWIRLFPGHFARLDGTTSFFVTDYTEVDTNVTRHLKPELTASDWDVMFLHYLGLDHIGHLAGPRSPLIKPKLQEMDDVVKQVYQAVTEKDALEGRRSLLIVCGDHGMSEQGSHGGSSNSETATPLVMLSHHWLTQHTDSQGAFEEVQQIDVAPTLASLLGVPVPLNSLGVLMPAALAGLDMRHKLSLAYSNAQQLLKVFKQNVDDFEKEPGCLQYQRAVQSHTHWLSTYTSSTGSPSTADPLALGQRVLSQYMEAMRTMRDKVAASLAQYDVHAMGAGIVVTWMVLLALACKSCEQLQHYDQVPTNSFLIFIFSISFLGILMLHSALCTSPAGSEFICSFSLLPVCLVASLLVFMSLWITWAVAASFDKPIQALVMRMNLRDHTSIPMFLLGGTILHTLSLLSSSFVEEEHQTWYFFTVTLFVMMGVGVVTKFVTECKTQNDSFSVHWKSKNSSRILHEELKEKIYHEISRDSGPTADTQPEDRNVVEKPGKETNTWQCIVATVVLLVLCRAARTWNQTGDKWAHLPDVGDWLVRPENITSLSLLTAFALVLVCGLMCHQSRTWSKRYLLCTGAVGVYCFRAANGSLLLPGMYDGQSNKGTREARIVYSCIAMYITITIWRFLKDHRLHKQKDQLRGQCKKHDSTWYQGSATEGNHNVPKASAASILTNLWTDVHCGWTLLMLLLLRPHNIAFVVIMYIQHLCLSVIMQWSTLHATGVKILVYIWMGQAAFFYQGNSNSLSSVDVSAGYVGLEDFNPTLIGILMAVSTYAGPVFWWISLMVELARSCPGTSYHHALGDLCNTLFLTRALPVAVYMVLVSAQRYHLFVWSVFSPKLLYEGMHTLITAVACIGIQAFRSTLH